MGQNYQQVAANGKPYKYQYTAGQMIFEWKVLGMLPLKNVKSVNMRRWIRLECICGKRVSMPTYYLERKVPKEHCGCLHRGLYSLHKLEYNSWSMMRVRCSDPRHEAYKHYGGRGIKVCDRWNDPEEGFANFLEDMGKRESQKFSLDRKDVNGNYEPGNCRWATAKEQRANQRPR
jgi:hypothetical protein